MARTRAQDYEAKRTAILRKSAELFARFGYSSTSIAMIAAACGASKALLYHYYHDKEEVLFDVIRTHLDDLITVTERAAAAPGAPAERVHALAEALLEAYRDADAEHQVQIAHLRQLPGERQATLRRMERQLVTIFSDALAEALPAIGRGPLLMPLTMSLFGMLNWQYLWFKEGRGMTRSGYARLATDLVLSGAAEAGRVAGPQRRSRIA